MKLTKRTRRPKDLWMYLPDEKRKRLLTIMEIQEVSARELARRAKQGSHTYIQRLLRGDVKTLSPNLAAAIAVALGVGMDDLFVPRSTSNSGPEFHGKKAS